jgi:hypothetical protein
MDQRDELRKNTVLMCLSQKTHNKASDFILVHFIFVDVQVQKLNKLHCYKKVL